MRMNAGIPASCDAAVDSESLTGVIPSNHAFIISTYSTAQSALLQAETTWPQYYCCHVMNRSASAKAILVLSASLLLTTTFYIISAALLPRLQPLSARQCSPMAHAPAGFLPAPPSAPRRFPAGGSDTQESESSNASKKDHLSDPYTW
jgi:hypothetical protein